MKLILIIEDNSGIAELISSTLTDKGYLTLVASSGSQALELIKKEPVDMIILDYSLPDMDGKEIIASIHKANIDMPPFIVSTGRGDEQLAVDMMKLGAFDYLVKDRSFISRLPDAVAKLDHDIQRDLDLKNAQQALKVSEERFRNFVEKSTDFFVKISSQGQIVYISPNWESHLGYPTDKLAHQGLLKHIHPDDLIAFRKQVVDTSKKENLDFVSSYRIKDSTGDWKYHEVKGFSLMEDKNVYVNCISRDVTESVVAEKTIAREVFRAEEKEKKRLAEQLHEGIGPLISAIKMGMGRIKSLKNFETSELEVINYCDGLIDDAVNQVRTIANDLMPSIINDFGLVKALNSIVAKTNINGASKITLAVEEPLVESDKITSILIYRAVHKLIEHTNKYISTPGIAIALFAQNKSLCLTFSHSGDYLPEAEAIGRKTIDIEIENIRKRIGSLDGSMVLDKKSGVARKITIKIPC